MAIGTPTQRYQARPTGQGATTVFSPATTLAAGTVGILVVVGGASKVASSVADSVGGNTWVVDATDATGAQGKSFVSVQVVNAITHTDTITVTWSAPSSSAIAIWLQEVTGLATSSVFDKTAHNNGTGTSVTSGSTGVLSQADEIAWAVFRTSVATTWTKGASWSNPTTNFDGTNCALEYQIVSATTALNADGAFGNSGDWSSLIATYKGAAAAASTFVPQISMVLN